MGWHAAPIRNVLPFMATGADRITVADFARTVLDRQRRPRIPRIAAVKLMTGAMFMAASTRYVMRPCVRVSMFFHTHYREGGRPR